MLEIEIQKQKTILRQELRKLRQQYWQRPGFKPALEQDIVRQLTRFFLMRPKAIIYLYAALPDEVNILSLVANLPGWEFALPRVSGQNSMQFYGYAVGHRLQTGAFGIQEPIAEAKPVDVKQSAYLLCPGLAFTLQGHRLGYGKGYYDSYICNHNQCSIKIGVAASFQVLAQLPQIPRDLKLDHIATEIEVNACSS